MKARKCHIVIFTFCIINGIEYGNSHNYHLQLEFKDTIHFIHPQLQIFILQKVPKLGFIYQISYSNRVAINICNLTFSSSVRSSSKICTIHLDTHQQIAFRHFFLLGSVATQTQSIVAPKSCKCNRCFLYIISILLSPTNFNTFITKHILLLLLPIRSLPAVCS